jgi:hypothetical protein
VLAASAGACQHQYLVFEQRYLHQLLLLLLHFQLLLLC